MYMSPIIVQALHEDRIQDAQRYARRRTINGAQSSNRLFSRISHLLRNRDQQNNDAKADTRRVHAI